MVKKPIYSKTLWINLLMALAAFIPSAQAFLANNPDVVVYGIIVINMLLRLVTKTGIQLTDDGSQPAAPQPPASA